MILNISRAKQFQECRQKAWNWHELRLMSWREAEPLMTGEAFHVGVAHFFATKNIQEATQMAEARYRERLVGQMILEEERVWLEQRIELTKRMILRYNEHYRNESFEILMPEVKFFTPLPDTEHHCWFVHRLLENDFMRERYDPKTNEGCLNKECYHPHYLTGRTDAVINWGNLIWLLEHKTTTNTGDIYYKKFKLDKQTTGYLYGIWKATGMRPHGFVLNVIKKPNKQVEKSNPFAVSFEREPFIRTDEDLADFEHDIILLANDYEEAFRTGKIYKNEASCTSWNRECYYINRCVNHQQSEEGEFRERSMDYVDSEYYNLLGLEPPKPKEGTFQVDEGAYSVIT